MRNETNIQSGDSVLKLDEAIGQDLLVPSSIQPSVQPLAAGHAEKGSIRSMWELLMQLRVLLPYLTRLAPLLDRGLLKTAPDMTEFRKDLQNAHAGSREVGIQVRNQTLQLERIEEQLLRLREITERNQNESGELSRSLQSLTGWVRALALLTALAFAALVGLLALSALRINH